MIIIYLLFLETLSNKYERFLFAYIFFYLIKRCRRFEEMHAGQGKQKFWRDKIRLLIIYLLILLLSVSNKQGRLKKKSFKDLELIGQIKKRKEKKSFKDLELCMLEEQEEKTKQKFWGRRDNLYDYLFIVTSE